MRLSDAEATFRRAIELREITRLPITTLASFSLQPTADRKPKRRIELPSSLGLIMWRPITTWASFLPNSSGYREAEAAYRNALSLEPDSSSPTIISASFLWIPGVSPKQKPLSVVY